MPGTIPCALGFPMIISSWGLCLFPSILWCTGRRVHHDAPAQNSLVAFDGTGPQGYLQRALLGCDANTPSRPCHQPLAAREVRGGEACDLGHSSPWSLGQDYGDPGTQTWGSMSQPCRSPCHLYRRCKTPHVHSLGVEILTMNSSTHYFI